LKADILVRRNKTASSDPVRTSLKYELGRLLESAGADMPAANFIEQYEKALATQRWEAVSPLVHRDACVTFSDGSVHRGKDAVRVAYERNFQAIADEKYEITNVHRLLESTNTAVYQFDFKWRGKINGQDASGSGRGTSVLVQDEGEWRLLAERLGPGSS